ncbi:MAG: DUF2318 domain-containing protein [Acidobacteria bacterium]|nr:DUF2318 domain-containing protein [Acidobacteriota bacterium]
MLSAFLIALREGVEAALVVGIVLLYLRKTARPRLERWVWFGVVAALVASVALAVALERFAWNQETVEGFLLLVAAVLLVTMIVWMQRVARRLRQGIEQRVEHIAGGSRFAALGLFLFVFLMVAREGAETVLMLAGVAVNTEGLLVLLGLGLGLGTAIALGVSFFKGMLPIRLDRFFHVTSLVLVIVAVQLTLTGLHELSEAMVIPSGPRMMALLGPIVRNEVFFFVVVLAAAGWLVARELLLRRQGAFSVGSLNEAEQRRERWRHRQQRRWMSVAATTTFGIALILTAEYVYARNDQALSPARPVVAEGAVIRIPASPLRGGNLHRFAWTDRDATVRFLVIEHPTGGLATALDACQLCGIVGYYQREGNVICKNCAAVIYIPSIGQGGGCNPIPLASRIEDDTLVIQVDDLRAVSSAFRD